MSLKINVNKISDENIEKINEELKIVIPSNSNIYPDKVIQPYDLVNDNIYLPFSFSVTELNLERPDRKNFPSMHLKFEGELRDEQKIIKSEAMEYIEKTGSIIISLYTGGGKTAAAINIAVRNIKLKTLIIVNKIVLIKQWEESILKFCPEAIVQKLTPKSTMKDADFYIMNAMNIEKMGKSFFKCVGLCIVDECHLIVAETLVKSFKYIYPRYLIGLSATPYRNDGLNELLDFYFGKNKIVREMNRKHIVYKVSTGIVIPNEKTEQGRVNWGAVLKYQSESVERNELIIKIIKHFDDRNFLILCKRVEQANYIFKQLQKHGESVDNLIGSKQIFDKDVRILVGIHQKISVGFDHPKLDTLLLATDLDAYFIQSLGRIFRKQDTVPMVFDLVDSNGILIKHYKNREGVYKEVGGNILNFNLRFPDFF
jgi:superfamily II DNA or RNA helicase